MLFNCLTTILTLFSVMCMAKRYRSHLSGMLIFYVMVKYGTLTGIGMLTAMTISLIILSHVRCNTSNRTSIAVMSVVLAAIAVLEPVIGFDISLVMFYLPLTYHFYQFCFNCMPHFLTS
ncbi:hypothetical protein SNEBB_010161 [Seison nebaliae]|nr:hypothetical protein SNEBB_010161 [Seison nebaliae]